MAFDAVGLQQFNSGGAIGSGAGSVAGLWSYVTNDAAAVVIADGYFDTTALKKNDVILAVIDADGTIVPNVYVVSVGTGDPASNDVTVVPMPIV